MKKLKDAEINPEDGKVFAYVYTAEGDTFDLQKKAFDMFTGRFLCMSGCDMFTDRFFCMSGCDMFTCMSIILFFFCAFA